MIIVKYHIRLADSAQYNNSSLNQIVVYFQKEEITSPSFASSWGREDGNSTLIGADYVCHIMSLLLPKVATYYLKFL